MVSAFYAIDPIAFIFCMLIGDNRDLTHIDIAVVWSMVGLQGPLW